MKTLDELDALYTHAKSPLPWEHYDGRIVDSSGGWVADGMLDNDPDGHLIVALVNAWPEVRERLRRAEADDGAGRIAAERRRQTEAEGWDAKHDDEHDDGALAIVAAALAVHHTDASVLDPHGIVDGSLDAWGLIAKHRNSTVRCLEIAGALIAAEIDRELRRAALTEEPPR